MKFRNFFGSILRKLPPTHPFAGHDSEEIRPVGQFLQWQGLAGTSDAFGMCQLPDSIEDIRFGLGIVNIRLHFEVKHIGHGVEGVVEGDGERLVGGDRYFRAANVVVVVGFEVVVGEGGPHAEFEGLP